MISGIYKITNVINGHSYIGQSKNIEARWQKHKTTSQNPNDKGYNYPLYQAFRKYGIENFSFEILEECTFSELNEKERHWIAYYDTFLNGYNQTLGGDSNCGGVPKDNIVGIINDLLTSVLKHEEIAQKWNISTEMVQGINTGRYWQMEKLEYPLQKSRLITRLQCYCQQCNKPISAGAKLCLECQHQLLKSNQPTQEELLIALQADKGNFSAVGRYFSVSPTTIRRWCIMYSLPATAAEYKKLPSKDKNQEKQEIIQYDLATGAEIARFKKSSDAAKAVGKTSKESGHITDVCKGQRKSAYGYGWRYTE